MDNEEFSIIIWCWHDLQTDITQLRLVRVDTSKDVPLKDGSFLLRISIDAKTSVLRCFIRHIASGSEAYVQGGPKRIASRKILPVGTILPLVPLLCFWVCRKLSVGFKRFLETITGLPSPAQRSKIFREASGSG